jgi:hypothetical protein
MAHDPSSCFNYVHAYRGENMSESNESSWDRLSEHGSTVCVIAVAVFLAIVMPWIMVLYGLGFIVWAGLSYAQNRQNKDKRSRET